MKKLFSTLAFLTILTLTKVLAIDASISHACFKGEKGSYIEFNIYILGRSVTWEQVDTTDSQAKVEVGVFFKQKGQVVQFDKYAMNSPKSLDPLNFEDLRRYALAEGLYDIEVSLKDLHKVENAITYKSTIIVDYPDDMLRQSDIQLLSYVRADSTQNAQNTHIKNGYYMEVLPFAFYDRSYPNLTFYNEIYNADKGIGDDFMVSYAVCKLFATPNDKPLMIAHKRKKAAPYIVNLLQLDISQLESGNYRLVVSVRNRANELLSEKEVMFQRSNPNLEIKADTVSTETLNNEFVGQMAEKDLVYSLKSILMKVPDADVAVLNEMMKSKDLMAQRRYIFTYYSKISPNLPEQAHDEYQMIVKAVDRMYNNGFGYGFETDRGRIYLRYGRPDDIVTVENEADAPPYEIWVYNKLELTQQTNVKFLFFNPSLIQNGFRLLHSNCRNELRNPRWKADLYKNIPNQQTGSYIDGTSGVTRGFNRRAEEYFTDN
jgi:GWxTD domain-containing protein